MPEPSYIIQNLYVRESKVQEGWEVWERYIEDYFETHLMITCIVRALHICDASS